MSAGKIPADAFPAPQKLILPTSDRGGCIGATRAPLRDELGLRIYAAAAAAVVIVFSVLALALEIG